LFSSARRSSSQLRKILLIARVVSCGENENTTHVVAQLVEALRYKPEDCGLDSQLYYWG
jgi:hypothetical protein